MQSHFISSHSPHRRERRPLVGLDEDSYPTIYLNPSLFKQRSRPSRPVASRFTNYPRTGPISRGVRSSSPTSAPQVPVPEGRECYPLPKHGSTP
jgi:hypothetical protein